MHTSHAACSISQFQTLDLDGNGNLDYKEMEAAMMLFCNAAKEAQARGTRIDAA